MIVRPNRVVDKGGHVYVSAGEARGGKKKEKGKSIKCVKRVASRGVVVRSQEKKQ